MPIDPTAHGASASHAFQATNLQASVFAYRKQRRKPQRVFLPLD